MRPEDIVTAGLEGRLVEMRPYALIDSDLLGRCPCGDVFIIYRVRFAQERYIGVRCVACLRNLVTHYEPHD